MQPSQANYYSIGVDVGGTNTDAVILEYPSRRIINFVKVPTSKDFYTGILQSIKQVLVSQSEINEYHISSVMIGTTAFLNAVVQYSSELNPVNVIRVCGTVSHAYPPFVDFPEKLTKVLKSDYFFVKGGYEFNQKEIAQLDEDEIRDVAGKLLKKAQETKTPLSLAICGIFSPLCADQEERTAKIIREEFAKAGFKDYSLTLSHNIAQVGLLEREGATILNAAVKGMAKGYINKLTHAIKSLNLVNCADNIYLTSNDGTLITCEDSIEYPIFTFNSGPTNSLRGASQLCQIKDALVVDIGGTTTDIAVLKGGFPRPASSYTEVAGVRTNFRMPDTLSIGLGGGSLVIFDEDKCVIGPVSVGYKLLKEAKSFGGNILTTTDIALASGSIKIEDADPSKARVTPEQIEIVQKEIIRKIEVLVDRMKTSSEPLPLILVGGGSILVQEGTKIEGVSQVIKPHHFGVANAVGAAISQVSAITESVIDLEGKDRAEEIEKLKDAARKRAIEKGAIDGTIEVIVDEIHLAYALRPLMRVTCKAVGDLDLSKLAKITVDTSEPSKIKDIKIENEEIEPFVIDPNKLRHEEVAPEMKPAKIEFNAHDNRKEWILTEEDVEYIAIGAGILGAGGGGSPHLGKVLLQKAIRDGKKIRVVSPDDLRDEEHAVASAVYGTPYVLIERMIAGSDVVDATNHIRKFFEGSDKKITCISTIEIGGMNSMLPLYTGGALDLPVVDVDFMGRAFPKYEMTTSHIYNKACTPVCMSNEKGDHLLIKEVENNDPKEAENLLRKQCIEFGCATGLCAPPLSKKELQEVSIKYSISRAWHLGRAIAAARKAKVNPLTVVEEKENGKLLFVGKIIDVYRLTKNGFTFGNVTIQGLESYKGNNMTVDFQNENLIAQVYPEGKKDEKTCVGVVPDLICLVDTESYQPILSEDLKYGLRVSVLYLPASPLLKTKQAINMIGPKAFGYEDAPEVAFEKEYVNPKCVINE